MNTDNIDIDTKPGYKKTKLGWIPEEWTLCRFDTVFKFIKSYSFSRNDLTFNDDEGDTYYIHYGDIHAKFDSLILHLRKENHSEIPLLKKTSQPDKDLIYLAEGDLVIADASEDYDGVGECIEIGRLENSKKLIAGLHTLVARDKSNKTVKLFRIYALKNEFVNKKLKKLATGSSVLGVSKTNLSKLPVILPPPSEQKKIAKILSTWDKAIAILEQLIGKKEELKKGLMQQLLTVPKDGSVPKKRFSGFEKKWRSVRLKDIGNVNAGGTPRTTVKKYWGGDIQWCTPTNITSLNGKKFISETDRTITQAGLDNSSAKLLEPNSIVVCTRATIGDLAIAKVPIATNQGFKNLTVTSDQVNFEFIYYILLTKKKELIRKASGSTFLELNSKDFKKIKIQIPSLREQERIVDLFSAIDLEIKQLEKQKKVIEAQKKGLMQQLLTGKKRVLS